MEREEILIIEDVTSVAMTFAAHLENAGYKPTIVSSGAAAVAELEASRKSSLAGGPKEGRGYSAIMLDLNLPDTDGLTLYTENIELFGAIPVIVATADGTLPRASEAVRRGAFDFLIKPISPDRLTKTVRKAVSLADQMKNAAPAAEKATSSANLPETELSKAMQSMRQDVHNASRSKYPALVYGELGSGRRKCAMSIHEAGGRADNRFIVVNCRDRVAPALEEEIFGITAGARPGVIANRIGALQMANGGTVFFDGIDRIPMAIQMRLFEFIETGAIKRVGSNRAEEADVRIIGGADTSIHRAAEREEFNLPLYYALVGQPIYVPALRERREDIIPLANSFLENEFQTTTDVPISIDDSMMEGWSEYDWPGNLVELATVVRQLASSVSNSGGIPARRDEGLARPAFAQQG